MNAFNRLFRQYAARIVLLLTSVFAAVHTQNAFALANCGLVPLPDPFPLAGCAPNFGVSIKYDTGYETSVTMNSAGLVVETHRDTLQNILYRVGKINGLTIDWGPDQKAGVSGWWPAVALGENGWVYLMYSNAGTRSPSKQYYRVGTLNPKGNQGQSIDWKTNAGIIVSGDGGFHASLSVMGTTLVGAYETAGGNNTCSYAIGEPNDPDHGDYSIHWYTGAGGKRTISDDICTNPHIAVAPGGRDRQGQIVLAYDKHFTGYPSQMVYERGSIQPAGINEKQIDWQAGPSSITGDIGDQAALALLPNGLVIELFVTTDDAFNELGELLSLTAAMNLSNPNDLIHRDYSERFDPPSKGDYPALTSNGAVAVETHEYGTASDGNSKQLYYSVSSLSDRSK